MLLYETYYYKLNGHKLAAFDGPGRLPKAAPAGNIIRCVCVNGERRTYWFDEKGPIAPPAWAKE